MSGVRAARTLALTLPVPAATGLVAGLVGEWVAAIPDEDAALAAMTTLVVVHGFCVVLADAVAAFAARALLREAPLRSAVLAEPTIILGAIRPFAAALLALGAVTPALRQPLVGVSLALLDAAFVGALVACAQPALGAARRRAMLAAAAYAVVRVAAALSVVSAVVAQDAVMLAHRLLAACTAVGLTWVFTGLARTLYESSRDQ